MSDHAADAGGFFRCLHCKGFYETSFNKCKWCSYATPLLNDGGKPKIYPDRETCRAIQIAEHDQLPQDVREDPMGPPIDSPELICACIHCGPRGHDFEAIEMRWMVNEQMWACPCTTCGGRGFEFDIHPRDLRWECVECGHRYAPADGRYTSANCKCPKCGCTEASGWFEDDEEEYLDEDFEDFDDEDNDDAAIAAEGEPWENDVRDWQPGDDDDDGGDDEEEFDGEEPLPDDIDFPHEPIRREMDTPGEPFSDDDIPF